LYKVSLSLIGSSIFRNTDILSVIEFCNQESAPQSTHYTTKDKAWANRFSIYKVASMLARYPADSWSKRIETNIMDIYTNDEDFYNKLLNQFSDIVRNASAPTKETIDQLDSPYTVVANKLPYDQYRYKVYLTPHAMPRDRITRANYLIWIKEQGDRIKISDAVKQWFLTCNYNWDRRYMLVEDEKTLFMLKLRESSAVGQTYKYVIAKK
jgi:hypothetical protein